MPTQINVKDSASSPPRKPSAHWVRVIALSVTVLPVLACHHKPSGPPDQGQPRVSRSLQLSADGASLWVVNPESDSISQIDVTTRTLKREIPLGTQPPSIDGTTGRYDPGVRPRAVALVDSLAKAYVAGQSANKVYVIDTAAGTVTRSISVGTEPTAVVASQDGTTVYVVNHQSGTVQKIDTHSDTVTGTVSVRDHPWGASLRANGSDLYVSYLFIGPGISVIDTDSFSVTSFLALPPICPGSTTSTRDPDRCAATPSVTNGQRVPNGQIRGEYTVVPKPNDGELWVPHLLLGTTTPQPTLQFDSTVFPTITRLSPGAAKIDNYILFQPNTVPKPTLDSFGLSSFSFTDSVSGPHDLAFTPDGSLALLTLAQSEDVMVFDGSTGFEVGLVRPVTPDLAGHAVGLLEGIVIDSSGTHAYVQGRSTHNVAVLDIAASATTPVTVDSSGTNPIECLSGTDPMAAAGPKTGAGSIRRGMRLFYSANNAAFPITQNFWVACASCHLEGQSDAVIWLFQEGPRDTPSNAGGPINTGFLLRQASRNSVLQYDAVIRDEQGGKYDLSNAGQLPDLQALADFVNYAIPFPQNPNVSADGTLTASQQHGQTIFAAHCAGCHVGPYLTDSGLTNPALDLCNGPVLLHDVGTCVTDATLFADQTMQTAGSPGCVRAACQFDTPTLRGVFATAPFFHDGSSLTLDDAVQRMVKNVVAAGTLNSGDVTDLIAYVKTL